MQDFLQVTDRELAALAADDENQSKLQPAKSGESEPAPAPANLQKRLHPPSEVSE